MPKVLESGDGMSYHVVLSFRVSRRVAAYGSSILMLQLSGFCCTGRVYVSPGKPTVPAGSTELPLPKHYCDTAAFSEGCGFRFYRLSGPWMSWVFLPLV